MNNNDLNNQSNSNHIENEVHLQVQDDMSKHSQINHRVEQFSNTQGSTVTTNNFNDNTLELLAERPKVNVERMASGSVRFSKQVRSETINVPVTLTQEVLVIDYVENPQLNASDLVKIADNTKNASHVVINGNVVNLLEKPQEIILSQQIARVSIESIINENVTLSTKATTHVEQIPVTLRHEELVTEEVKLDNPTVISTTTVENPDIRDPRK